MNNKIYEFDNKEFNKEFEYKQNLNNNKIEDDNSIIIKDKKRLHEMSIGEIMINMKNEIFSIIYEILSINFNSYNSFIKIFIIKNRLFYIGLFLIIICILLFLIDFLLKNNKLKNVVPNINNNNILNEMNNMNEMNKISLIENELYELKKKINESNNLTNINDIKSQLNDLEVEKISEIKNELNNFKMKFLNEINNLKNRQNNPLPPELLKYPAMNRNFKM